MYIAMYEGMHLASSIGLSLKMASYGFGDYLI